MKNEALQAWILLVASHTCPSRIHWCEGTDLEFRELCDALSADGALHRLNSPQLSNCFLEHSRASDALASERRFVCTPRPEDVGPTNRWLREEDAYRLVWPLFANAMKGRTLFVAPYLLGAERSRHAQVGVQLTDSPLAVLKLRLLTRMGRVALEHLGRSGDFVRGLHCRAQQREEESYVVHFPATQSCWSIGSERTDSAVFGHKWHALNMASVQAPEEGYLAEHMSVARVTSPTGRTHHLAAAFPSGAGKTQFATLTSTLPRWHVELVADGMCFLRVGDDGRLWALNPAAGIDGFVGSQSHESVVKGGPIPSCDAIFTTHRCIARAGQWPSVSRAFHDPEGVPISAILFGGRRASVIPLIFEATSWEHGIYVGASLKSEVSTRAGARTLRHDPMAMVPYCSYNMGDYFGHWLRLGRQLRVKPRIFHVNWFREDDDGKLLWPGFGDNVRVIRWITERVEHAVDARRTPIGFVPKSLALEGLAPKADAVERLLQIDVAAWLGEAESNFEFLSQFGRRLPPTLTREHDALMRRLRDAMN